MKTIIYRKADLITKKWKRKTPKRFTRRLCKRWMIMIRFFILCDCNCHYFVKLKRGKRMLFLMKMVKFCTSIIGFLNQKKTPSVVLFDIRSSIHLFIEKWTHGWTSSISAGHHPLISQVLWVALKFTHRPVSNPSRHN